MLTIEQSLRTSNGKIIGVMTNLYGLECQVFEPVSSVSIYDEEDQEFVYNSNPDYVGKLLITGINELRFGSLDDWSPGEVKLFTPTDSSIGYVPLENSKIIVNDNDNEFNLRVLSKRAITGQHLEIIHIFELVGFN